MKKGIRLGFLGLLAMILTSCQATQQNTTTTNQDGQNTASGTVMPEIPNPQRRLASGFFITNKGHFLTSYHVTQGSKEIYVTTSKGKRVPAKVMKEDAEIDIVLAKVDIPSHGIPLGTQHNVDKGDEVLTLGYPLLVIQGKEQKATFGRINAFSGIRGDQRVYQIDVPLQPGNSGGPLISENGVVIGIVKATFNQLTALQTIGTLTQNINYAVKSDQILPMLRNVLGGQILISNGTHHQQEMSDLITQFEKSVVLVEAY